ncbi:hypothetical protein QUW50_03835 [Barnesiella viscericola]|uniref:hypothetical protein n=1 Tax=Barnesiella viscericola TaxID=397865 RepID=UPI0025A4955A|nr:hypothetical protein [Barnesiella viscericola]MDM8268169.1 hypothetical protein [Barnesiella viscericola]
MDAINSIYKDVRRMFQSAVPPYVATINDDYHYEVWAVKQQTGESRSSEELLGYVAKHDDSVTVGFNNKLDEQARKHLFSNLLLTKMNGNGRISIQRMTHQLHTDLQEAVANLMRYYSEMNWI